MTKGSRGKRKLLQPLRYHTHDFFYCANSLTDTLQASSPHAPASTTSNVLGSSPALHECQYHLRHQFVTLQLQASRRVLWHVCAVSYQAKYQHTGPHVRFACASHPYWLSRSFRNLLEQRLDITCSRPGGVHQYPGPVFLSCQEGYSHTEIPHLELIPLPECKELG
jgi:hypothetical protein